MSSTPPVAMQHSYSGCAHLQDQRKLEGSSCSSGRPVHSTEADAHSSLLPARTCRKRQKRQAWQQKPALGQLPISLALAPPYVHQALPAASQDA